MCTLHVITTRDYKGVKLKGENKKSPEGKKEENNKENRKKMKRSFYFLKTHSPTS